MRWVGFKSRVVYKHQTFEMKDLSTNTLMSMEGEHCRYQPACIRIWIPAQYGGMEWRGSTGKVRISWWEVVLTREPVSLFKFATKCYILSNFSYRKTKHFYVPMVYTWQYIIFYLLLKITVSWLVMLLTHSAEIHFNILQCVDIN